MTDRESSWSPARSGSSACRTPRAPSALTAAKRVELVGVEVFWLQLADGRITVISEPVDVEAERAGFEQSAASCETGRFPIGHDADMLVAAAFFDDVLKACD